MTEPRPFHRFFSLSWVDFCDGSDITVDTELDMSLKQQFIDLVLTRTSEKPQPRQLPDGFDNLSRFNLVTLKSHQEALDWFGLCELIGHFVNYRKQSSPSKDKLLPASDYQLYAVCVRFPSKLSQQIDLIPVSPGVLEYQVLTLRIRIIVVNQLPEEQQNAMLHLLSASPDLLRYGQEHYRPHSKQISTLLYQLLKLYAEDEKMSEKMKELLRQSVEDFFKSVPLEERLKGVSPEELLKIVPLEELLKGMPAEERLKGMPAEERLEGMPAEERLKVLSADELLKALPPEVVTQLAQKLKNGDR